MHFCKETKGNENMKNINNATMTFLHYHPIKTVTEFFFDLLTYDKGKLRDDDQGK